jgi:ribosomal protein L7/L12
MPIKVKLDFLPLPASSNDPSILKELQKKNEAISLLNMEFWKKIQAIKLHRTQTGSGLKEAKHWINARLEQLHKKARKHKLWD